METSSHSKTIKKRTVKKEPKLTKTQRKRKAKKIKLTLVEYLESESKTPSQEKKLTMKTSTEKGVKQKTPTGTIESKTMKTVSSASKKRMNEDIIQILEDMISILTTQGEHFRAGRYKIAQETVMSVSEDITDVNELKGKKGIGPSILKKLQEFQDTGKIEFIETERKNPAITLTNVYGVGYKGATKLVEQGITTIDKLKEQQDTVLNDTQKKGLKYYDDIMKRIPRSEIEEYVGILQQSFDEVKNPGSNFEIVGSYRRGKADSGDIDVIITDKDGDNSVFGKFLDVLIKKELLLEMLSRGKVKSLTIGRLPGKPARRLDFLYSPPDEYAFAVLYFTGSKAFNTFMRRRALEIGYTLNEHGIYKMTSGKKGNKVDMAFPDEKSIFDFLSMEYREPEERIDGNSVTITQAVSPIPEEQETEKDSGSFVLKPSVVQPSVMEPSVVEPETKSPETFIIKVKKKKKSRTLKKPSTKKSEINKVVTATSSKQKGDDSHRFPILYGLDKMSRFRVWSIWVEKVEVSDSSDGYHAYIYTEYGLEDGKKIKGKPQVIKKGKNLGKINATTTMEQAVMESQKKWINKKEIEQYTENKDELSKETIQIRPMLAQKFEFDKSKANFPAIVQPKLDGVRCMTFQKDGEIKLMSRQGKFYKNLPLIREQAGVLLGDEDSGKIYLDGELGSFGPDAPLTFQEAIGIIAHKKETMPPSKEKKMELIQYVVYDLYHMDHPNWNVTERFDKLQQLFTGKKLENIELVASHEVENEEDIIRYHQEFVKDGYEGTMIRDPESTYQVGKRSKGLQKYKDFLDSEFKIVGFKQGKGNDVGTVIWKCETESGKTFDVRPTGSREMRMKQFEEGEKYIGKKLTVKYQEMTDEGVPRFPVGISIRDYE